VTRLAIVDDHRLFSAALAVALQAQGVEVAEPSFTTLVEIQRQLADMQPDVVLVDRDLGDLGSGEELIAPMADGGTAVAIVSATLDDVVVGRCLALGAVTCIPKTAPFETVLTTVLSIAAGKPVLARSERERFVSCWHQWQAATSRLDAPFARLTPREAQVLGKLMDGRSVRAIAADVYVSEATVRSQVRAILVKLGVNSQLEAVALATRANWQPPFLQTQP
jgi:two-component system, NarL family, nitrate/nitrite response regulator NarL